MKMSLDKKIERFDRRYKDKGGYAKLVEMIETLATLEMIGKYFDFSRQNAAVIYKSFFGKGYTEIHTKRRIKKQLQVLDTSGDIDDLQSRLNDKNKLRSANKVGYIKLTKKVAEKLGYDVLVRHKRSGALEVFINGYKCAISGSRTQTIYHIPQAYPPSIYYRFAVPSKAVDFCIFVLELEDHYTFYIIPHERIIHLTLITLKDTYAREKGRRGNTSNKYSMFRNKWDQFKEVKLNPEIEEEKEK